MTGPVPLQILRLPRSRVAARRLSGALLALAALADAETKIYRYEDAQGITVFADRAAAGRKEVALHGVNTYIPVEPKESVPAPPPADVTGSYRSLSVTGPGDGETIRRNGGNVRVTGRVEPGVREDHRAVLLVNGAMTSLEAWQDRVRPPAETRNDIEFALTGVARGPHTVRIAVLDREHNVLIQSVPVRFHLLRAATGQRR